MKRHYREPQVGDRVKAFMPSFGSDLYQRGEEGTIVEIRDGGWIIRRADGRIIGNYNGTPYICDPQNWERVEG